MRRVFHGIAVHATEETSAMSDNGYRCGHAPCQCTTAPGGDAYCSDHCREAAASGGADAGRCGCGHEVCESNPEGDLGKRE